MNTRLSDCAKNRDNNFNLLRFVAALLVLYSHSFALVLGSPDVEPPRSLLNMSWGNIAVDVFFITSGFLIASSFFSPKGIVAFTWARILRIYPALLVAVAITVFLIGPIFTSYGLFEYFSEKTTYRYLIKNSLLFFGIEWRLPGVFENNPMKAVNGSLWTLPFEVKMYCWLAVFGSVFLFLKRLYKTKLFDLFFLFLAVTSFLLHVLVYFERDLLSNTVLTLVSGKFIQLFSMFFIGVAFFVYRNRIRLSSALAGLMFLVLILSILNTDLFFIVYCLTLPYLILYVAYVPKGIILSFNKFGDYSYGLYVYAYPVQQACIALIPNINVTEMILMSFVGTFFFAFFSWHVVEKRALSLKDKVQGLDARVGAILSR